LAYVLSKTGKYLNIVGIIGSGNHPARSERSINMVDDKAARAMKTAIEMEISGYKFFMDAASQVESEAGKKMFTRLGNEEIEHQKTFQKIFDEVTGGGEWKAAVKNVQPAKRVPYFDDAREQFEPKDLKVDLDFLNRALELERNAMQFFDKAVVEAENPEAAEVFRRIRDEEQLHYDLIQSQIDNLTQNGYWFDVMEYKMDGQF
jgi:rubrerythrin